MITYAEFNRSISALIARTEAAIFASRLLIHRGAHIKESGTTKAVEETIRVSLAKIEALNRRA